MLFIPYIFLFIALVQLIIYAKSLFFDKEYKIVKKDKIRFFLLVLFYIFAVVFCTILIIKTKNNYDNFI